MVVKPSRFYFVLIPLMRNKNMTNLLKVKYFLISRNLFSDIFTKNGSLETFCAGSFLSFSTEMSPRLLWTWSPSRWIGKFLQNELLTNHPVTSLCRRYILIAHHSIYDRIYKQRNIVLMIICLWLFCFGIMTLPLIEFWGRLGLDPPTFSCTILKKNGSSPKKFLFLFGFLFPCIAIIICYSAIYYKVRMQDSYEIDVLFINNFWTG